MDNKRFLLVHPESSRTKYNFAGIIENEPLELEYISAALREAGFEPYIWDGQVEKVPFAQRLRELSPAYVYVCGRTKQENFMMEYLRAAKESGAVTMAGGIHVQHNYTRFFTEYTDFVFTSFDIYAIIKIVTGTAPETVASLCFKREGCWTANRQESFDISLLPRPDRTYFYEHPDRYRYLELEHCAHVRTSYCCPYRCSFCLRNRLNCGVYTVRSIEDTVDEIECIPCENIYFIDDDFLFDERRISRFIELVRERGIRKHYVCYGRADFIAAHGELMKELKSIGFYYVLTGLEAVDERYLDRYNKRSDISANSRAVRIANESGINLMGMFIVDLDFRGKDFRSIYRWAKRNHLRHAAISIFTPEMNSCALEEYRSRLITRDPSHWDYLHVVARPDNLTVRQYYMHYHILLIKLFLRAWRQGIYDFIDYGDYIRSFIKNLFRFGG